MENEILENKVIENEEQNVSLQADYYDYYYDRVLSNLNTISVNSNTIIQKQDITIERLDNCITFFSCTLFLLCLGFVLNVMRKMLDVG